MHPALTNALTRFKAAPRSLKIASYCLLAYLLYAILLGLATPALLESQLPKLLEKQLGRQVSLEKVRINPFLLRLELDKLVIAELDKQTTFAAIGQLGTQLAFWQSITNLAPTVDYLHIEHPEINIKRQDATRFNFTDILETLASQAQTPSAEPAQEDNASADTIPALIVSRIALNQGEFAFTDQLTSADLRYHSLDFTLDQFDTRAFTLSLPETAGSNSASVTLNSQANRYALSLSGSDDSSLLVSGQFQLLPLQAEGDLALSDLSVVRFWPFVRDLIQAQLTGGTIDFASHYRFSQQAEQVSFATNSGQFSLSGLRFDHAGQPKIKLKKLTMDQISVDGDHQQVNISKINLQGLQIDSKLSQQGLDLQALFTPTTGDASPSSKQTQPTNNGTNPPSWVVNLTQFGLNGADLNLQETVASQGVHWRIHPLDFSTGKVTSRLDEPVAYQLSLAISSSTTNEPTASRGTFTSKGEFSLLKQQLKGDITLNQLDLSQLQPYLFPYLNIRLRQGSLSSKGQIAANNPQDVRFSGQAQIDTLLIHDGLKDEALVKWQQLALNTIDFNLQQQTLNIAEVALDTPYAKLLIAEDKRTNFGEVVVNNKAEESEATTKADTPTQPALQHPDSQQASAGASSDFSLKIDDVSVRNGSAYFADDSLTPSFASGIESLQGHIRHLSSVPGTKASVDLQGKVDKYAPLTLKGEVNPLTEPPYLALDFSLSNAELTSVNPYSGTYVGRYIDKGQLSLNISYQLDDNQLQGSNHLVIDQLKLGKKSESDLATDLPISLAIALLQDRNGLIDLGVDVSGDVNSPDFSIGAIVLKAFTNIITKAVTAPFSLLANLVGSDQPLNIIHFAPGQTALTSEEQNRLDKLAGALKSRPGLSVSIEGAVLGAQDSSALAESRLQQKLLQQSGLPALPEDLSASRMPLTGPLPAALQTLYQQELNRPVEAEQVRVEQMLLERRQSEGNEAADTPLDPQQLATVLHMGMYNQLVNAQDIKQEELGILAEARARAVKSYLVEQAAIPAERVFVLDSRSDLKSDQGAALLTLDVN